MNAARRARAEAHVRELGHKHAITVRRVSTWEKSGAFRVTRIIYIARELAAPIDYLCALHEFGHILYRPSAMRHEIAHLDIATELTCEAAAWGWAIKHVDPAVVPCMTPSLRGQIGGCWTSFIMHRDFRPTTERV